MKATLYTLSTLFTLGVILLAFNPNAIAGGECRAGSGAVCGGQETCCKAGPNFCHAFPCAPAM